MVHHFPFRSGFILALYRPWFVSSAAGSSLLPSSGAEVLQLDLLQEFPDSPDFHYHRYSRPVLSSELLPALRSVPHPVSALPLVYPLCILRCPHPVSVLPLVPPAGVTVGLRLAFPSVLPRWLCVRVTVGSMVGSASAFPSDQSRCYGIFCRIRCRRLAWRKRWCSETVSFAFLLPEQPHIRLLSPRFHLPQNGICYSSPEVCFLLFLSIRFSSFSSIPTEYQIFFCWLIRCRFAGICAAGVFRLFSRPPLRF